MEKKNTSKIWVCIDFRNLNKATLKDEYPMCITDMLINNASGHRVISLLDGNVGYNQIFMAEEDMSKTAFRYPGFIGLFEWVVMSFGLKNVSATYQRAMNLIFHDLLGIILEVYIDDVVLKSNSMDDHLAVLCLALKRMCQYGLKINPLKCVFGVSAGKFLAFIIHEHNIEIDPTKVESINKVQPPQYKNDMQKLLGKVNYLRWFISNLSEKISAFAPILRLKHKAEFTWGGKSATRLWRHQKILIFAASDESTYGRDPISVIHRCRGCCDWGCFDASNGGQETHHHLLVPMSHWRRNKVPFHQKVVFIFVLCLFQITALFLI
jgi:hypothetical protein